MRAVLVVNGIFLCGILLETVYILLRARKEDSFMENLKFLKAHLNLPSKSLTLQEFIENTKKIIKEETTQPPQLQSPFSSTPGKGHSTKHLNLDQIYTKLVVVPDIANHDFTGDRLEKLEVYTRSGGGEE